MEKIVAVVGLCGSGKSLVSEYFEALGYHKIHFGSLTMEEVKRQNLPVNEANERIVREQLRSKHGMGAYATLSLPKIEESLKQGKNILIDGLYSFTEYKILKERFGEQILVLALFTPKSLRYNRLSKRPIRPLSPKKAEERDFAEIEHIEKGGPIAIADYTLLNDGDSQDLNNKLSQFIERFNLS